MSEWLDLMLEEIARKRRESREAKDELARRKDAAEDTDRPVSDSAQSK
jgi:hypothetical protein